MFPYLKDARLRHGLCLSPEQQKSWVLPLDLRHPVRRALELLFLWVRHTTGLGQLIFGIG